MTSLDINLHGLIAPESIIDLKSWTKRDVLKELCDVLEGNPSVTDPAAFLEAIYQREELASTGVGLGVAIPHVKIPEIKDYVISVGRKPEGLEFDSLDGEPVRLVILIGASDGQTRDFVRMLARVMRLLKNGANRVKLLEAKIPEEFLEVIKQDDIRNANS